MASPLAPQPPGVASVDPDAPAASAAPRTLFSGNAAPDDPDEAPAAAPPAPLGSVTGLTPAPSPQAAAAAQASAPAPTPPPVTPTTARAPQTESKNPLTGDNNTVPAGQTTDFTGGIGAFQKQFTNPTSANIYDSYVKNLFGPKAQKPRTGLRRTPGNAVA